MRAMPSWLSLIVSHSVKQGNLAYSAKQGSRVSCLGQNGLPAFDEEVQPLFSGSPYAEVVHLDLGDRRKACSS